jgi:hypothetical protein
MTPFGPVRVEWRIKDGTCRVTIHAPAEVTVTLEPNQALQQLNLTLCRETPDLPDQA